MLISSLVANASDIEYLREPDSDDPQAKVKWLKDAGDHYSRCLGVWQHVASRYVEWGFDASATSYNELGYGTRDVATVLFLYREYLLGNDFLFSSVFEAFVEPQAHRMKSSLDMAKELSEIQRNSFYHNEVKNAVAPCNDPESLRIQAIWHKSFEEVVARDKLVEVEVLPSEAQPSVSMGTCFFVSRNGHVVTNFHVVEGFTSIAIADSQGESFVANLLKTDAANDLAILKVATNDHKYLSIAPFGSLIVGQEIFTMGFPVTGILGQEPKYTNGVVSSLTGYADAANVFQMTVPIQPGNSGGPVVNMKAEVVGIVSATATVESFLESAGTLPQNVNWAVKSEYAALLVPNESDTRKRNRQSANPIDATSAALCSVVARE